MDLSRAASAPEATPPHPAPKPSRFRPGRGFTLAGALLLVMVVVATAHWPVLGSRATSLDDGEFVKDNVLVTHPGWASTSRFFREVLRPSTVRGYYLPLTMTSLMVDYALGGRFDDLRVFHRTSLALHLVATALMVLLLYRLFGALLPATLAGLLFGLHPLTVEPVAWIGERKTLLAACFALASLLAYVRSVRRGGRGWTVAALGCFLLALLSKPTVTTLPLLLLLLDWWPLKRLSAKATLEKWPFFALSLASGIVTVISHERSAIIKPMTQADLLLWPLHAGYLLTFYLGKILAPVGLTCVYPPPKPFTLSNPLVVLNIGILLAVVAIVVVAARRFRAPLSATAFFVLAIAPTLGLVQYSWVIASDKYVYFPAVGLMLAITAGLVAWNARRPGALRSPLLVLPLVLILAAEAYGTRVTLRHWKDTPTLFRYMERLAPESGPVKNQLALIAMSEGKSDEALRMLTQAVAFEPGYGDAHYDLGILLAARGRLPEAIEQLRYANAVQADDPDILGALGATLRLTGKPSEATPYLRQALRIKPGMQQVIVALSAALVDQGQRVEGADLLRRALAAAPNDLALRYQLAAILLDTPGGTPEAVGQLRKVIAEKPDWAEPLNTLAWVLATSPAPDVRDPAEARRLAGRAAELTAGKRPEVLDTLAAALAAEGHFGEAVQMAHRAAQLARSGHGEALAREIESRMRLYQAGSAYSDPGSAPHGPSS